MNQDLQLRHQRLNRAAVGCTNTHTVLAATAGRAGRQTDGESVPLTILMATLVVEWE